MLRINSPLKSLLVLLFLISCLGSASAQKSPKWMVELEATWAGPPTKIGTPVKDADHAGRFLWDGRSGCWDYDLTNSTYIDDSQILSGTGVDVVENGIVVASGWRYSLQFTDFSPELDKKNIPFDWPKKILETKGITLGKILGYVPTYIGKNIDETIRVPCTLIEAGQDKVALFSHESDVFHVFWYSGQLPEIFTQCLVSWDDLVVRTEAAIQACDCNPVIDELWPHNWGAPTPGATDLLQRCDDVWRKRVDTLTSLDDIDLIAGALRYKLRRSISHRMGTQHANMYPTYKSINWLRRSSGNVDESWHGKIDESLFLLLKKAIERTDLSPAETMLATLLHEALNQRNPMDLDIAMRTEFLHTIPEIKNLSHFGLSELDLLPVHPGFSSRVTRSEKNNLPHFWAIEDIEDLTSWRYTFDGPWAGAREIVIDLSETPEYKIQFEAYAEWNAELNRLQNALLFAEQTTGGCKYQTFYHTTTRQDTYSTYDVITTSSYAVGSAWVCPQVVEDAQFALEAHSKKNLVEPKRYSRRFESDTTGKRRDTEINSALKLTIGSDTKRWVINGKLDRKVHERSLGSYPYEYWPQFKTTFQGKVGNVDPVLEAKRPGSISDAVIPEGIAPFTGTWLCNDWIVRVTSRNGEPYIDLAYGEEFYWNSIHYAGGETKASISNDGSITFLFYFASSMQGVRGTLHVVNKDSLRFIVEDPYSVNNTKYNHDLLLTRSLSRDLPFTEVVSIHNNSDFPADIGPKEALRTRGILLSALLSERPEIASTYRAELKNYFETNFAHNKRELLSTLYILGYPVEVNNSTGTILLLEDWMNAHKGGDIWKPE